MRPKTLDDMINKLTRKREDLRVKALEHDRMSSEAWVALRATDDAVQMAEDLRDDLAKAASAGSG